MTVIAIVQARMGSTRLPNKVMKPINGVPMIELLLARLSRSKEIDQIVVATSINAENQPLVEHISALDYSCEQGSEDDVLDRYVQAAKAHHADVVVRITGDCPLVDPELVDECIRRFRAVNVDYFSNTNPPTYPDGLDIEVVTLAALETAMHESDKPFDHEHVTPYVREAGQFKTAGMQNSDDLSALRWTVDEPADFEVISKVFAHFAPDIHFTWQQVLQLQRSQPQLFAANQQLIRNEGAAMGTGQKLWKRAKQVIPGGSMLLSKRAEMFLPNQWPAYFSKAKGCKVWDLEGREFIDMSIMGIGTNILGYGHPEVDEAVRKTVELGNMSTFNCPEEVYLAEKLIEMHTWADMARFARSGGEANAIAVRIARAATGKDQVAICGYHGWHDWYMATNLTDEMGLDGHLLPGLNPRGVPKSLKHTTLAFSYNNIEELKKLLSYNDVGIIKMEVSRSCEPEDGFLESVRELATENDAVLIFDECSSGFRETYGGLHKKYGVEPDMAIFGKALGNGYAITATIGKREIMEAAQSTFISSTFWTERIGPTAALKTLEVMKRDKSWEYITTKGKEIGERWLKLAEKHGLPIELSGIHALISFKICHPDWLKFKTLITQEMLKKDVLAANSVYVCTEHSSEIIDEYFENLDPVFGMITECLEGREIDNLLEGPVCHAGFSRLN